MASTYEPIATTTLGSAASSITFSSIPSTYTDLRIVFVNTASSDSQNVQVRFNSDSTTNYSLTRIGGDGSSATSGVATNQAQFYWGSSGTSTTVPQFYSMDIFSYAGSSYKTFLATASEDRNGSGYRDNRVGMWRSTSVINTITIFPSAGNWNAGTTATLHGLKSA